MINNLTIALKCMQTQLMLERLEELREKVRFLQLESTPIHNHFT